jgi:hypothetical protein
MNKFRFTINILAIALFMFAFASFAQAQASRTWVSGVGDDANPCSRTAPCKTFAGAISKTAVDGEIDVLDPGGFGAVTITKSITIDGNGVGSVLVSGTSGIIVNVTAAAGVNNMVQIRNLSINGIGTGLNGIRILNSLANTSVFVENCVIFGFRGNPGRGISDERTAAGNLFVLDCLIKDNSGAGIAVIGAGATKAAMENTRSLRNGDGFVLNGGSSFLAARNCVANNNTGNGFTAQGGSDMTIIDCQTMFNATGIQALNAVTSIRVGRTSIVRNTTNGLDFSGGTIQSFGNNELQFNSGNNGPFTAGGNPLQ